MTTFTLTRADFGMTPEKRLARMRLVGDIILAEWSAEARGVFRSTLPAYLKALASLYLTETSVTVELPGPGVTGTNAQLARILEFGMGPGGIGTEGPYDVRKFLLQSGTASLKRGKNGPYVNVPFMWRIMDIGLAAASKQGAQKAVTAASNLAPTVTHPGQGTTWGGRLGAGMAERMRAHHVSDPLQGLVRKAAAFSRGTGSRPKVQTTGFMTWRTASWANTDPRAWLSSGVKAARIGDKISARLADILQGVV